MAAEVPTGLRFWSVDHEKAFTREEDHFNLAGAAPGDLHFLRGQFPVEV